MDPTDVALRNVTYAMFVELGRAPTAIEIGDWIDRDPVDVIEGWRRLHDAHALVLNQHTDEIRMAHPFSAVPTSYRVQAAGRSWFANCAWDAFGICAALHVDGDFGTSCPDCGEAIAVAVVDHQPSDVSLLFHCLVPAARWWNDIVFT
jgi:alkylmercury lyase-like protein